MNGSSSQTTAKLGAELKRAEQVASEKIPQDIVTMNSRVRLKELKSGRDMEFTIVYPQDADLKAQKVSVLAPVGTAILGCKTGEVVDWPTPQGTRSFKIEEILYQPEASGHYHL
jgi:regulator of nucleoside diphosphate kinase